MSRKAHLPADVSPAESAWSARAETEYEQGEINPNQARQASGLPILEHTPNESGVLPGHVHSVSHPTVSLELVDEDYQAPANAPHETTFKEPPKANTSHLKAVHDNGEALSHGVVPFGWDAPIHRAQ